MASPPALPRREGADSTMRDTLIIINYKFSLSISFRLPAPSLRGRAGGEAVLFTSPLPLSDLQSEQASSASAQ